MKKYIILAISLLSVQSYSLTLQEAINSGLKENLQIRAARKDILISKFQLKEDRQLFYPVFISQYNYTWLKDTPYTSIPPNRIIPVPLSFKQTDRSFYQFNIGLAYPLYTGGVRPSKIKISKLDIKEKKYNLYEKENQIKADIKKAYYDVLMAKNLVSIYREELKSVKKHLETVKAFYKEGLVTKVDILQAEVRLSEIKRDLRKAQGDLKIAKSHLAVLIGKSVDFSFQVEPLEKKVEIKNPDIYYLISRAYNNRAILKSVSMQKKKIKYLRKIYKGEFLPKIRLSTFYSYTDKFPYLSPKGNTSVSLDINLSFQGIRPYFSMLKTKEMEKKISILIEDIKKKIALQVKSAYENLQTAIYNLNVAEKSLKEAEKYYELVTQQYRNQLASGTDVIDAEAALTRAKKSREISFYQYLKAVADLEQAVGGSIE